MTIRMFLNGSAMSGGAMNHYLRGAPLLGRVRTAPKYRFHSVRDEFPGLFPVAEGGTSIEGELFELSEEVLRDSLLPVEPAELELGVIELEDGSAAFSMLLRPPYPGTDISGYGGWRAYLEASG
jgi:gamma-glutamylcyclotransferase (GGCT)/AIG2-like uncharacterized protein YtfP